MKISDILSSTGRKFPSIEIVPPLRGVSKEELLDAIRPMMQFNPPYINVTCHRDGYEFVRASDGSFSKHVVRMRVSQTAVCAAVQSEFNVEVVPHLICGGATADDIKFELLDLDFLGIHNVMALRGDSLTGEQRFTPEPGGYSYASQLVGAIRSFGAEKNIDFCIGVGAYPEKHFEAPNLQDDIANLKKKVDAGADFIITQMFYDNDIFYRFRDMCTKAGINVPIIPGLKPISSIKQVEMLPEAFSLSIPQTLVDRMRSHSCDAAALYDIGREWGSRQCADLLRNGAPTVHFYTMGRQDNVIEILKENF